MFRNHRGGSVNVCNNLQESLDAPYSRSRAWQLFVSYKKYSFMVIGSLKNEKDLTFHLGNNIISIRKWSKTLASVQTIA